MENGTEKYVSTVNYLSAALAEVKKTKWVLLFLETPFRVSEKTTLAGHEEIEEGTLVSDVTILRLKFVTAGKTADYNVFACYDSQSCKPKFYDGHFEHDFDYSPAEPTAETLDGYIRYLQENDDELPKDFYQKRGKAA